MCYVLINAVIRAALLCLFCLPLLIYSVNAQQALNEDATKLFMVEGMKVDVQVLRHLASQRIEYSRGDERRTDALRLKTSAINTLGATPGTNHVDVLVNQLGYLDERIGQYPAIRALEAKGMNAVAALKEYILTVTPDVANMSAIGSAGFALEKIIGTEEYRTFIEEHASRLDVNVLGSLMARRANF